MDYTIQQDGSTWGVACNGRLFITGLTRADALKTAGELQRAALVAELAA